MKKTLFYSAICCYCSFLFLNLNAQTVTQKANFGGSARAYAVGFSIGTKGYIGTGWNGSTDYADLWEYDPSTNVWTQKANFGGSARSDAAGFSIGTKGYIGTGLVGTTDSKDFWEYDPSSNTWTQKADFGGTARGSAVGLSIGTKGYIGTGRTFSGTYFSDFWEYDPSSNAWTQKANFGGSGRQASTAFSIGTKGYIGTGRGGTASFFNDFWEYDPSSNAWTQKANFGGTARGYATGFGIGTKGYLGTGYRFDGSSNIFYNNVYEYTPSSNTWASAGVIGGPNTHYATAGFNLGIKGYLGTGRNSAGANLVEFWEYDPTRIITGSLSPGTYCSGASLTVPFTSSELTFSSGNVFTAQLSNWVGSFASPVNIGTLTSTSTSGNISATIPGNTPSGTGYRIRVVSSNPASTGSNNGTNLTINGDDLLAGGLSTSIDQSIILELNQSIHGICQNTTVYLTVGATSGSQFSLVAGNIPNTYYFDGYHWVFEMPSGSWASFSFNTTINGCNKTYYFNFQAINCNFGRSGSTTDKSKSDIQVKEKTRHINISKVDSARSQLKIDLENGKYYQKIIAEPGKSKFNIDLVNENHDYKITPNPAKSQITIYSAQGTPINQKVINSLNRSVKMLVVTDMVGNQLIQRTYPSTTNAATLNISNLASGLYVVKIYDGEKWTSIKFIKEE
jgi:hypothetical protein